MVAEEIKFIYARGESVAAGCAGEICVRGPQVVGGYWQRPEATAEAIDAAGWFRTGDIGTLDDDGYVRIVDRLKDMVIVSGFNVYPNEIEGVVYGHPDITECAAIGIKDDKTGEAILLYVVSTNPQLMADEIQRLCRRQLTAYKVPRMVKFSQELPKSPAGKILRRALRDQ
jgi:long-chain acyl-CoA synthetase